MPAHTFGLEWLDLLLRSDKQGTTRPQSTRIKVGDIVSIYIKQRGRIVDKPVRQMTAIGTKAMADRVNDPTYHYPAECPVMPIGLSYDFPYYYAHFLGKVAVAEVYDIHPCEMTEAELKAWAVADGFKDFEPQCIDLDFRHENYANWWFSNRYGNDWMRQWWTVERWDGWLERYFEPEAI